MRRFWIFCVLAVFFPYVATLTVNGTMKGIGMERFGEGRQEGDRRIYLEFCDEGEDHEGKGASCRDGLHKLCDCQGDRIFQ